MSEEVVGAFVAGVVVGLGATLLGLAWLVASGPWRKARFSGVSIPFPAIVGMRLRGTPPDLIVAAAVALNKRGITVPWMQVEVAYLAYGTPGMESLDLAAVVENELASSGTGLERGHGG